MPKKLIWARLTQIWAPNVRQMLSTVANYNYMEFQEKHMVQIQENGEKPHFGPDLGLLNPNSSRQNIFSKIWLRQSLNIIVR